MCAAQVGYLGKLDIYGLKSSIFFVQIFELEFFSSPPPSLTLTFSLSFISWDKYRRRQFIVDMFHDKRPKHDRDKSAKNAAKKAKTKQKNSSIQTLAMFNTTALVSCHKIADNQQLFQFSQMRSLKAT